MTSQRVDPEEHAPGLPDFLRRHDAFLQVLVTVLGHAYGAPAHDVFQLTRAVMHDRWSSFGAAGEEVRVSLESLAAGIEVVHQVGGEQIADVGDDPGLAGLDELVVVELLDIVFNDAELLGEERVEGLERVADVTVAD